MPNIFIQLNVGDTVYVAFENNNIKHPVILGYLSTDSTVIVDITGHSISISESATLPADTSIGNVSATEISYLNGLTANIQQQLNDLSEQAISRTSTKGINTSAKF